MKKFLMKKISAVLFLQILAFSTFSIKAEAGACSAWKKQDEMTCLFANSSANFYHRQCQNPCQVEPHHSSNMGPGCDQEEICYLSSPDLFKGACSDWHREDNVKCLNPMTQAWEQRWVRACTIGIEESWCSDKKPN